MKNQELTNLTPELIAEMLKRPASNLRTVEDGVYTGEIRSSELVVRESKYTETGYRTVLNIRIGIKNNEGEPVDLYIAPNFTWGKKGNMYKLLEKLDALPAPGEDLDLDALVGIPVREAYSEYRPPDARFQLGHSYGHTRNFKG